MSRPVVYIASPYSGIDAEAAVRAQVLVASQLIKLGFAPLWPLCGHYVDDAVPGYHTYQEWLSVDLSLVERCDALLRLGGESKGADMEEARAVEFGLPVARSVDQLVTLCDLLQIPAKKAEDTW